MENSAKDPAPPSSGKVKFVVFGVVVAMLVFWAYALSKPTPNLPNSPLVNQQAREFSLPDLASGELRHLRDWRGKYVVLNFWASWCTACRSEVAELEALHRNLGDSGVSVLGIVVQDEAEDARAFAAEFQQTFPSLIDTNGTVAVNYGITGLPETFVFNPEGSITRKFIGPVTREMVLAALNEAGFGSATTYATP